MDKEAIIKALRDAAQSASNTASSNLSVPVDAIAAGLRNVGVPIDEPVGGAIWMERNGLTVPVDEGPANIIGETIGLASPILATKFLPQISNSLIKGSGIK